MEPAKRATYLNVILHVAFFASGISTVLVGPLIPIIKDVSGLRNEELAYFFPIQIAGSLTGTALTWWFARRSGHIQASLMGCILMGLGILVISSADYAYVFPGLLINGIGIGLTLPSINMIVVELNPTRTATALNTLNFFWGLGAILCQPLLGGLSSDGNIALPATVISSVLILSGIAQIPFAKALRSAAEAKDAASASDSIWTRPLAWFVAAFNFIHIGYETSMGGWLPEYTRELGFAVTFAPIVLFYIFFVAGRLVSGVVFPISNENKAILIGLIITTVGMFPQLFATDGMMLMAGACISGFGTSWIFPTTISRFSTIFGESASRNATPFFMVGSTGAAAIPWLTAQFGTADGKLGAGMFVLLGSLVVLILMQVGMMLKSRR
jgi:CP family cyanate transporter-like MFS transporter